MFVFFHNSVESFKKQNFGFGKNKQNSSLIRLGVGVTSYLAGGFKFTKSKKISLSFLPRVDKTIRDDLSIFNSSFNINLQKQIKRRVSMLKLNRSLRGVRHAQSLPVRGQRTKTNARTRKSRHVKKF